MHFTFIRKHNKTSYFAYGSWAITEELVIAMEKGLVGPFCWVVCVVNEGHLPMSIGTNLYPNAQIVMRFYTEI
jgi:hypothetical protein